MEIEINLKKSVEENAEKYYEKAKKAKKKLKGVSNTIEKFNSELHTINKEEDENKISEKQKTKKKYWFEKFRWFLTSSGKLVIGGRDATTNEIVIKKHTTKDDLVFHTDMKGSPFFVIQSEGKEIGEKDIKETADATCSFSKAWKNNMLTSSVFYVNPDQVTKEAKAGEYLGKGSFVIKGKTNYIDNKINLAIGVVNKKEGYEGTVLCAPEECVSKYCSHYFKLEQGENKTSDIAKRLKKKLKSDYKLDSDEIIRALPTGGIKLGKAIMEKEG